MVIGSDRCMDVLLGEPTSIASEESKCASGNCGRCARFVLIDVTHFMGEDFIARNGLGSDRRLVGHGSGGHETGCLLAKQLGASILERNDARIVAKYIIAQGGGHHGLSHSCRGLGDGVTAEIDCGIWHPVMISGSPKRLTPRERPGGSTSRKGDESCVREKRRVKVK